MSGRVQSLEVSVVFGANEEHIAACLASLEDARASGLDVRVTVFANDPTSVLADELGARFPWARIVRNAGVRGFAENHNDVLRASSADYVLVLNDDVILRPGAVRACIDFLERPENARVASLSPRLLDPDGSLQRSTYAFPTPLRAWLSVTGLRAWLPFGRLTDAAARMSGRGAGRSRFWAHDRTVDVDTFRGACMFVRSATVHEIGAMDEASRIGVEEVEWHRRALDRGWRVVFFADAEVVHFGSRTIRLDPSLRNEYLKGFLNFFRKHRSPLVHRGFAAAAAGGLALRAAALGVSGKGRDARVAADGARVALRALGARDAARAPESRQPDR